MWLLRIDRDGQYLWNATFGGERTDEAFCLIETDDGGFILIGSTRSFGAGSSDGWVVRADRNGQHLWNMTYGGAADEEFHEGIEVSHGGYAFVGYTYSFGEGFSDGWMIRTRPEGEPLWNQTYGEFHQDWLTSVVELRFGGFALTGGTASYSKDSFDVWILQTKIHGEFLWNQSYG